MLARVNRLTEKSDFERVKKKGRLVQSDSFALALYFRKDTNPTRFGFVISTNISSNATKRNYIKRALGESLRHSVYSVKEGYDGVFLVKPAAAQKYMAELMPEVTEVLKKADIVK